MSINPHGPHLERAEIGMVLDCPLQDGATFVRGVVIEASDKWFRIRCETMWPGVKVKYAQGTLGIVLVSNG